IFSIDPSLKETNIRDIAEILRKYYKFRSIPNDFFVQKPALLQDPNKLKLHTQYTYPITNDKIARKFFNEAKAKYKINFPINQAILTANPTNKPRLSLNPTEIKEFNITIPITSFRILVETAKLLRKEYYFEHIPLNWINIPIRPNEIHEIKTNKKPMIPTSLVQLQEALENITDEIYINVTIK
ncbi:20479_t:CDS:1, partial [Racocetra persica]